MPHTRKKSKGRADTGRYFALPKAVTDTQDFMSLTGKETKVLLMLLTQYNGKNNGDFSAPITLAKQWGVSSKETLTNALRKLVSANLITRTREGRFLNPGAQCALYAVTWFKIDECKGKLDVQPTITPPRQFTIKNKTPSTESVPTRYRKCTDESEKHTFIQ